jgi:hypothetical protein
MADYLSTELGEPWIDRRVTTGAKDTGDIGGVYFHGSPLVLECKDYGGRVELSTWMAEAKTEAAHAGALVGIVLAKRRGTTDPSEQWALMTASDLVALLTAHRHEEEAA